MINDLKQIKKKYGEKFMHLCREMFPVLLDEEGLLYELISSSFAMNARTLYEDIEKSDLQEEFKNYIYEKVDVEKEEKMQKITETPYELLDDAGYDLIECLTEEEIQDFKKYYKSGEALCTFRGGRLDRCVVFFAVKKDVERIKREDFDNPKREDEYGTSVMGIQFSKKGMCTVSIKNRYNHRVNNPDSTYGNDLDRITPGLTDAFARLLQERGLKLNDRNKESFEIPNYVVAGDGKYYKYNYEINGVYYCPGNIIIENGEAIKLGENELLLDCFVLNSKTKEIQLYDDRKKDSFLDGLTDLSKIKIIKTENRKQILLNRDNQENEIIIDIDKDNKIIGYNNKDIQAVGDNFLEYNKCLTKLEMPKLETVGNRFLYRNERLTELEMPNLKTVGDEFLEYNRVLTKLEMPNLKTVGYDFLAHNNSLTKLEAPNLETVGDSFLYFNDSLTKLKMPNLKTVGDNFLAYNNSLTKLEMPNLKTVGYDFLVFNKSLTKLEMPKLETVDIRFLEQNIVLTELEMQNLKTVGDGFLFRNECLTELEAPNLETVGDDFLAYNKSLTKLEMSKLETVGDGFLAYNNSLTKLEMPNLKTVGDDFLVFNKSLTKLEMPKLETVGNYFLDRNKNLKLVEKNIVKTENTEITSADIAIADKEYALSTKEVEKSNFIKRIKESVISR